MSAQKNILVVDDDKDLVSSVQTFLEARGFVVRTAHNSGEAMEQLKQLRPDLMVLDIMMDYDAEGFNLAHSLKNNPETRSIPIIILSGFMNHLEEKSGSFEHVMGQNWPAAKFFEKPVVLKNLADSITKLIEESERLQATLANED